MMEEITYKDKLIHFGVCCFLSIIFTLFFNVLIAIGIVLVAGIGKELWDKYVEKDVFDWLDLMADILGGLFGLWLVTLIG